MTALVFKLLGGIGLFLMGMVMLTDGLKAFAGQALRTALMRFTGSPLKAFASGAVVTAMVQSSSATTVTVIGFVSAGLLTFPQALGVVFGASLGTTGTGWIVSVLGLKISLGFYALPLVGIGAFLNLLGAGRIRPLGIALAGFGLIFIGIETLQAGMQGLSGTYSLANLPSTGLLGHTLAVIVGTVMTVIMQSSSAAVATTLTALHTNTVNFEQAASLLIGAAIGTTVTGVLAAIGGTVPAKRTALAHVLFNMATGVIALILLPFFLVLIGLAQKYLGLDPGATSLAAFHTGFIATGVLIFLPFVNKFSNFIERVLPERGPKLTRHLDDTLLSVPAVALEATRRALSDIACEVFAILRRPTGPITTETRRQINQSMGVIQDFYARIPTISGDLPLSHLRVGLMHAIDHILRLMSRMEPTERVRESLLAARIHKALVETQELLETATVGLKGKAQSDWIAVLEKRALELADVRSKERPLVLKDVSLPGASPARALELLDALRWLDRVAYHSWRTCVYLNPNTANGHTDSTIEGAGQLVVDDNE